MNVEITFEKPHNCKPMKDCSDTVFIQTLNQGAAWYLHIVKNHNQINENTYKTEIAFCPYCGIQLPKACNKEVAND